MTKRIETFVSAYTNANEPVRWIAAQFPDAARVLTVAASGDQAMFHHLAGATHIDTFDITPYARVIQEIKLVAIRRKTRDEYAQMLRTLNKMPRADAVMTHPCVSDIMPHMSAQSRRILHNAAQCRATIFGAGGGINDYPYNIPTAAEYAQLRNDFVHTFDFVFSDITDVHTKVAAEYDLINTSNIFDWFGEDGPKILRTLMTLTRCLNMGGRIIYIPQWTKLDYKGLKLRVPHPNGDRILEYVETRRDAETRAEMIVLQRTR